MRKSILFAILSSICFFNLNAQFSNIWKVGNGYGIDFNATTPTITASALNPQYDNSSAISDASGNLLFYTNGLSVWDKNNTVMPNGSGLTGHASAGQCAVIVPIPCSTGKYVIFHVTEYSNPGYLSYSVVDMALNSGLGDVVVGQKNISLGSGWTEKLCAYYNPAGNYYWLLTHKWNSDQFVAFKVDVSSIAVTSVTTSIGSIHNCGTYGGTHDAMGQLTISPDGSKVVNALTCADKYELFDLNISTGILSNSISIPGNTGSAWATAFSPDSKKLYTDALYGGDMYQYDISTYSQATILASKYKVYSTGVSSYNFGYMELGPNGKIYIPRPNTNFNSIINLPNSLGSACTFSFNGLSLGSYVAQWGTSRIAYNIPLNQQAFSLSGSTSNITCYGMSNGSGTVSPSVPGSYSFTWSPGSYSTSVANNLTAGNYTITVSDGTCTTTSTILTVSQPQPVSISVTPSTLICSGNSAVINSTVSGGTPAYTYSWSNGSSFSGTSVNPVTQTTYTLIVNDANGCNSQAVTTVSVTDCTGIAEIDPLHTRIYPNPVTDKLYIDVKTGFDEIIIKNLLGQTIKIIYKSCPFIEMNDFQNGIYMISIYQNKKLITTRKIIKSE